MWALTLDTAKNIALVVLVVFIVVGLLVARFVANVTIKVITLLVLAAMALGVWTQRASLQSCTDDVRASGATTGATCSFFGTEITIKAP